MLPSDAGGNEETRARRLEPCLVKLFGQSNDDAITMAKGFILKKINEQLAIDRYTLVEIAAWCLGCLYLLHPGQAIGSFLHREHLPRVLFDVAVALPQFESDFRAISLKLWAKIRRTFLA
jgi:hypothetical protein